MTSRSRRLGRQTTAKQDAYASSTRKPSGGVKAADILTNDDDDDLHTFFFILDDEQTWPVQTEAHTGALIVVDQKLTSNHHHAVTP